MLLSLAIQTRAESYSKKVVGRRSQRGRRIRVSLDKNPYESGPTTDRNWYSEMNFSALWQPLANNSGLMACVAWYWHSHGEGGPCDCRAHRYIALRFPLVATPIVILRLALFVPPLSVPPLPTLPCSVVFSLVGFVILANVMV